MGLLTPKNREDLTRKIVGMINNHETIFKSKPHISEFNNIIKDIMKEKRNKWITDQFNSLSLQELITLIDMLEKGDNDYGFGPQEKNR